MNTLIIIAILAGTPLVLSLLFRLNAIALFLAVATGALLAQYIADDASLVISAFSPKANVGSYVQIGLLILPFALSLLFLRKTLSASKVMLHILPLVVTSLAFTTLIIGYLPGGVQHDIVTDPIGKTINSAQNVLIAASAALTMIVAWITMGPKGHRKH